jgi:hypothetical protein
MKEVGLLYWLMQRVSPLGFFTIILVVGFAVLYWAEELALKVRF